MWGGGEWVKEYRTVDGCTGAISVFSRVSVHGHLNFTSQKTGVGTYTDKPFVCITHRIIKKGGGRLHEMGDYSREYGNRYGISRFDESY